MDQPKTVKILKFYPEKCKYCLECEKACSQVHFKTKDGGEKLRALPDKERGVVLSNIRTFEDAVKDNFVAVKFETSEAMKDVFADMKQVLSDSSKITRIEPEKLAPSVFRSDLDELQKIVDEFVADGGKKIMGLSKEDLANLYQRTKELQTKVGEKFGKVAWINEKELRRA